MAEIGQVARALIARPPSRVCFALLALAAAAIPAFWLWPFTIDDAWIPIRYARHLADGTGYRFDAGGPATDGVTPLPWAFLLSPLAHAGPAAVLGRAKALGCAAWFATAAAWGAGVAGIEPRDPDPAPFVRRDANLRTGKFAAVLGLATAVPLAAHAVSGMETAVATALATAASLLHRRARACAALAGLAASFRPEMLPWALTLVALVSPRSERDGRARTLVGRGACVLLAAAPFVVCVTIRVLTFGHPAPLAVQAKPSDLAHGSAYVLAGALVAVGPMMACAPGAAWRERGPGRAILAAGGVHLAAVAVAGGDWMPYARLIAPVVPSLLYAAALLWPYSYAPAALVRAVVAIGLGAWTLAFAARAGRRAGRDRDKLGGEVAPIVAGAARVAAVDVGWLSSVTEADIVDLAGVTDPEIAALGGGHTSKRVDAGFLLGRDPDALVFYARASELPLDRWAEASFPRAVEARLAHDERVRAAFEAAAFVPLGATRTGYYVLRRKR